MAGLRKNSNASALLQQWHQLFADRSTLRSTEAHEHWQQVERLLGGGLPTDQHEHWKYTALDGMLACRFALATLRTISTADCNALSLILDACRLVFIDGCLIPVLSDSDMDVWQVEVEEGIARRPLPAPIQPEVFLHLTESLSQETTRIHLPAGKVAPRPLYLLHISHGCEHNEMLSMMHYRHHLAIEAGSKGQVIEHFVSMDGQGHFSGTRTSMAVGDHAHLSHIKLAFENQSRYHFGHNDISVGCDARVNSVTCLIGAGLTRHQTSVQLNGEGSAMAINSLLLPSGQDISDTCTYVEHNQGSCLSRQLHKVIARDRGKAMFNGLIKVAKYARNTDGQMTNNNLLLDGLAEVYTKPQLEIYNDDVKCSHGITVGRIDDEQMFYLRSRGMTSVNAQQMMIDAFASEVTEAISHDTVRDMVLTRIADNLRGSSVAA